MLAALDVAKITGVALGGPVDGCPNSTTWTCAEDLDRAMCQLRQTSMELFRGHAVTHVAIERPLLKINRDCSAQSLEFLTSLAAVVREAATRHGAKVVMVETRTWRRSFIGTSSLERDEAKLAAKARCRQLGWPYKDDNAAEAMGLWYHCAANMWPRWRPSPAPKVMA